jgi:simple sugar transport system permease protein
MIQSRSTSARPLLDPQSPAKKLLTTLSDNVVTVVFVLFILVGFAVAESISFSWFLSELTNRFYRNAFLVLSLIIPVIAGLGLNFGIVVGAISGQIAIVVVRYFNFGGISGLILCFLVALPIAAFVGYLTGMLYNKTRGQEMIAGLIVSYFATGIYYFLFLFVVGMVIPVSAENPLIMPNGVGVRMSVDMGTLKYSLKEFGFGDMTFEVPFMWVLFIASLIGVAVICIRRFAAQARGARQAATKSISSRQGGFLGFSAKSLVFLGCCVVFFIWSVICIATNNSLMTVQRVPLMVLLPIVLLCVFTWWILRTKLGQDFRSVGQSQYIAESNGINVNLTRIIATMISTVLGAWGMILLLQDMGTLATYTAHNQIGYFSVAAILVGGASVSRATVPQAIIGTLLFHAMTIMSPEIGKAVFGQAILGEYFRTFMVYGILGLALVLYVWRENKRRKSTL